MACLEDTCETNHDEDSSHTDDLFLGLAQTLLSISDRRDSISDRLDPSSVKVIVESLGATHLGVLEDLSTDQTVSDLKAAIVNLIKSSGKAPGTMLLYNGCPLNMESTLAEAFEGNHEVTINIQLVSASQISDSEMGELSPAQGNPSPEPVCNDQLWESVQKDALEQINEGSDEIRELPYASSAAANRCLEPRGYELPGYGVDVVGSGSFGKVFKAIRKGEPSLRFVVKRQPLGRFDVSSVPVLRETAVLHALRGQPNIVKVVDVFLAVIKPEVPEIWAVLESYAMDLEDSFSSFYEESKAKVVIFQVLLGINSLHRKHIVHRDLKPRNILLRMEPEPKVAICDFGMSRSVRGLVSTQQDQSETDFKKTTSNGSQRSYASRQSPDQGACRKNSAPLPAQPPQLKREFSVHVMTSNYRAPEMFGFADVGRMRYKDYKSLDIYALGLIWAKLLAGVDVVMHADDHHPSEFLLLENLKKVDCPDLDAIKEDKIFKETAIDFIELVLTGNMDAIRERWKLLQDPPYVQRYENRGVRETVLEAEAKTIDGWIKSERERDGMVTPDVLQLIRGATKFCYAARLDVQEMLMHSYFDSERTGEIDFSVSQSHVEDVKVAMDSQLNRLGKVIDSRKKCPKLSMGQPPSLTRSVSEEKAIVDMQAICDFFRAELDRLTLPPDTGT